MLKNDPSNSARGSLLDEIEGQTEPDDTALVTWIAEQRALLMTTLKPLDVDDTNLIIDLCIKRGGIVTFKDA